MKRSISRQVALQRQDPAHRARRRPARRARRRRAPARSSTDAVALGVRAEQSAGRRRRRHALRDQLKCQKRIGRAVADYVGTKLALLIARPARRRTPRRRRGRQLDKLPDRCAVTVAAGRRAASSLPAVGPQCAAAVRRRAAPVDATALRDCLATLLEVWVDRCGPNPQPLRPNILFILTDDQRWDTTDGTHSPIAAPTSCRGTRAELADSRRRVHAGLHDARRSAARAARASSRASTRTAPASTRTAATTAAPTTSTTRQTIATWLQGAGYRTSLIGKYLNGYPQLWDRTTEPPYVPPGWTEWRGMRQRRVLRLRHRRARRRSAATSRSLRQRRGRLLDRRAAREGEDVHQRLGRARASRSSSTSPSRRRTCRRSRRRGTRACSQGIPPWRPPSYNEADVSDKPTLGAEHAAADAGRAGRPRPDPHRPARDAAGGRRGDRRQHDLRHHRHHGAPPEPRHRRQHDRRLLRRQRLALGRAPHCARRTSRTRSRSARRCSSAIRSSRRSRAPTTRFALNIDLAPDLRRAGRRRRADRPRRRRACVRVLDGTAPTWRTDFLTEGWPDSHPWATRARGAVEVHRDPGRRRATRSRPSSSSSTTCVDRSATSSTNVAERPAARRAHRRDGGAAARSSGRTGRSTRTRTARIRTRTSERGDARPRRGRVARLRGEDAASRAADRRSRGRPVDPGRDAVRDAGQLHRHDALPHEPVLLRRDVAVRLSRVHAALRADGLGLLVWDCYRPFGVQQRLWALVPDARYVAEPVVRDGRPVFGVEAQSRRRRRRDARRRGRAAARDAVALRRLQRARSSRLAGRDHGRATERRPARGGDGRRGLPPLPTEWWHFDGPGWERHELLDRPLR